MAFSAAEIVAYQTSLNNRYIFLATHLFVVYDWIITFDQEIDLIWRDLSWRSAIFLINRYAQIFETPALMALYFGPQEPALCKATGYMTYAFEVLLFAMIGIFSAARTWALTKNKFLFALVLSLGMIPSLVNLYWYINSPLSLISPLPIPIGGCYFGVNLASPYYVHVKRIITPLARTASIACDLVVLVITWVKIFKSFMFTRKMKMSNGRFGTTDIMLIYGTGYFGMMLVMNIIQFMAVFIPTKAGILGQLGQMNRPIASLLISRFILDLKRASLSPTFSTTGTVGDFIVGGIPELSWTETPVQSEDGKSLDSPTHSSRTDIESL